MAQWALDNIKGDIQMHNGRPRQKNGQKSRRNNRYSLAEKHRLGISATARAKVRLAEKLARQKAAAK